MPEPKKKRLQMPKTITMLHPIAHGHHPLLEVSRYTTRKVGGAQSGAPAAKIDRPGCNLRVVVTHCELDTVHHHAASDSVRQRRVECYQDNGDTHARDKSGL